MSFQDIETIGVKCHQPVLEIAVRAQNMQPGDVMEVWGDCLTVQKDVRTCCERLEMGFLFVGQR
jgi:tRNA 2-thiouridine synthesizing protein A